MRRDPTEFRERFAKWKAGEKVYENGLPMYGGGKSAKKGPYVSKPVYDEFDAFLQTLPDNQRALGAYNTRRYWELNGKPKDFAEAIGKGMYTIQNDNGVLNWHGKSVAYNENSDTYEFMKPNYHPTRWMELVYGYDQSPEFQKDWKVQYNGPMLSDRYVRREKPGLKIVGGQLPEYKGGKGQLDSPKVLYTRQNNNPVKFDEQGNLVDLVTGETGTMMLPEVRITPKRYDAYHSTFNPDIIRNFTDWLPIVGDIGTGVDIKNAIKNQNYLEASLLGGLAVLPAPLAKGANKLFRPLIKKSKRLFLNIDFTSPLDVRIPEAENHTWSDIIADKYADKIASKHPIRASKRDREIFKNAWDIATRNNPVRSAKEITEGFRFSDMKDKSRFVNLVNRNPEYYEFLRREGIEDPLSQESVSRFLDNLFTSVRGVVADNAEDAYPMLVNTEYGRHLTGGDRLDSYGGIYTSNSTTIADRFKNPVGNKIGNGYVAKVKYPHNISTDIPIEDLLEEYRKKILLADNKNPLRGTEYYYALRANPDIVALEADYVGRASEGNKSIQERVYLPTLKKGPQKTLDVVDLQEYKNQSDLNGRWMARPENGSKAGLFIPRMLNNYSDFIRSARLVLSPKQNRPLYNDTYDEALKNLRNQSKRRNQLIRKQYDSQRKIKNAAAISFGFSPIAGVAGYSAYRIKKDNEFYDSPEYTQLLHDPLYDKYIELDDGSFTRPSSFEKLERTYRNKYRARIRKDAQD